jgi:hypothetical protein
MVSDFLRVPATALLRGGRINATRARPNFKRGMNNLSQIINVSAALAVAPGKFPESTRRSKESDLKRTF